MNIKNLLITRFSAMGDVAMCVPVVWSLAKSYPNLKIFFLSRKNFKPMFANMPKNVVFVGVDLKNNYKGISGLNKLFSLISSWNIDAYADFHDVLRTKYLIFRAKISGIMTVKLDKGRKEKRQLTKNGVQNFKYLKPTILRYKDVLEKLGFEFQLNFKSIYEDTKPVFTETIIEMIEDKQETFVGVAPFAAHKGKILPLEKTETLVSLLTQNNCRVFLFGAGEYEKSILENWQSKYKNAICVAGKSGGIANELALISQLDYMVSMDSANMHLASLVATRTISVWGATHIAAGFLGYNQSEDDAVQVSLNCRPCSIYGDKTCKFGDLPPCLEQIDVQNIVTKIISS